MSLFPEFGEIEITTVVTGKVSRFEAGLMNFWYGILYK